MRASMAAPNVASGARSTSIAPFSGMQACPARQRAGEWYIRREGGIDEQTLEIRAAEFTSSDVGDAPMLPQLLDQIPPDQEIASVTADGAYDTRKCHDAIHCPAVHVYMHERGRTRRSRHHSAAQERQAVESCHRRCSRAQRGPAGVKIPRPCALATMERLPPPKPRRNQNALCETAGPAPNGEGLRSSGG